MYSYMYSTPSTYVTLWVKFKPTGAKGEKIQSGHRFYQQQKIQPWPLIQRVGSRSLNNLYSYSIGDVQCLIVLKGEKICYRKWFYTQIFYLDPWSRKLVKSQCTLLTHTHSMGEVWAQHGQREGEGQGFSKG